MKRVFPVLVLCVGLLMLSMIDAAAQEPAESPPQAYPQAAGALLQTYLKEQGAWNHYFTNIAPEQGARAQITPQENYRRFLADTLAKWRQLPVTSACQSTHFLYELALYSYSVAADFRLTLLFAKATVLGPKKVTTLAEKRSRHYTSRGDAYFKQAAQLAQASGCAGVATPE